MALDAHGRLEDMKVAELRQLAKQRGLKGYSKLKKTALVQELQRVGGGSQPTSDDGRQVGRDRLPEMGTEADRVGAPLPADRMADLDTDDHDQIRAWAAEREAVPATEEDWHAEATESQPRVLLFRFPGAPTVRMQQIDWPTWFRTFDRLQLRFVYVAPPDGTRSNEFRFAYR